MSATLDELAAGGLEITGSPKQGLDSNLQYWISDPDGNPIELMQMMPTSPQAAADASMTQKQVVR
jgi:lactoylglutathione lyase